MGGLGLIHLPDRIQATKIRKFLNAASQRPKSDNIFSEIGTKQRAICGTNFVESKAEETNDTIKLLAKKLIKLMNLKLIIKTLLSKIYRKI